MRATACLQERQTFWLRRLLNLPFIWKKSPVRTILCLWMRTEELCCLDQALAPTVREMTPLRTPGWSPKVRGAAEASCTN